MNLILDAIQMHKMRTSPRSMYSLHKSSAYGLLGADGSQNFSHQLGEGVPENLGHVRVTMNEWAKVLTGKQKLIETCQNCH